MSITPERLERAIQRYGAKGSADYAKAYMTYISPGDFLSLTTANKDRIIQESHVLDAARLRQEHKEIFLRFDPETGEITGHEGRHRMAALEMAGVQRVAIMMISDGTAGRYERSMIDKAVVSGQRFEGTQAGGVVTLHNLIPANMAP